MSEQNLLTYTGAIAGIIGAVAAGAGAIFVFLAFRRTGKLKARDLRLELRRTESELQSDIHGLVPLLEKAKDSRTHLAAAQGSYLSGATKHWLSQWDTDLIEVHSLVVGAPALDVDCATFSQSELEARLIAAHRLQLQVSQLTSKYRDSLAADDSGREQLRADRRVITQARLKDKT